MNSFNYGDEFRTKKDKGDIPALTMVKVTRVISHSGVGICSDKNGNENEYNQNELTNFGYIKLNGGIFDILEDHYRGEDQYGNKDVLIGRSHITKNVRGSKNTFKFWDDCLYTSRIENGYDYEFRELTDQEIVNIILEEIIYGVRPDLDSISCVGTSEKGIDKDPNYRDGNYYLPNEKDYTVTWCYGTIKIREGIDGGWYSGTKNVGREIYEGKMDWERYKIAKIRQSAKSQLRDFKIMENYPDVIDLLCSKIQNDDKFKLNSEFI